jgi:hypothetical protein
MLNYQRVHLNARTIHFGGADLAQLGNSFCIELALSGDHRKKNLQKNRDLVKRSGGLIADINDSERYLSLGCGHTVAFCKAAVAGTKTCERDIAGRDGKIDRALLERNAVFKQMITTGWGWWVIPAEVDIKYPEFARICQKALNIANQVGQEIGDLEVGMTIVEYIEDAALYADGDWKQRIVALVKDSGASCAGWTDAIITFVQEFSGGKDGPLMKFVHNVAQQFSCGHSLGPGLWAAVSNTIFSDRACEYNLLRVAVMLLALSAKREEGIPFPTIIKGCDIIRVAARAFAEKAKLYERILSEGIEIAGICLAEEATEDTNQYSVYSQQLGQLFVRIGCIATRKGALGPEGTKYELPEIQSMFLDTMSARIGRPVKYPGWGELPSPTPKVDDAPAACPSRKSLQDGNEPKYILKKMAFRKEA